MAAKRFVVLMNARSGSTWLITLLNGQPGVAAYEELLMPHPVNPKYAWLAADAPDRFIVRRPKLPGPRPRKLNRYLAEVEAFRPGALSCGFKVNAVQFRGTPELLPILALRGYRLVVLVRNNVFESSVSQIAMRLGGDAHGREAAGDAPAMEVDPAEVVTRIHRRLRWIGAIRSVRRFWPWPSVEVAYEALVADQADALAPVLRAIGIDAAPVPVESPLKRRIARPYDEAIANYPAVAAAVEAAGLGRYLPGAEADAPG
jgi:LPS sulfotransferase NodH